MFQRALLLALLLTGGGILAGSGRALAAETQLQIQANPARAEDVVGYWSLVPLPDDLTAKNKTNPWPHPFQYFAFYANGDIIHHAAAQDPQDNPATLDRMHDMLPATMHFRFEDDMFIVTRDGQPRATERWGVSVIATNFTLAGVLFKAGDLLMSLDDGQGNVLYRRHLRRLGSR